MAFLSLMFLIGWNTQAQDSIINRKNQVSVNMLNLAMASPNLTYERTLGTNFAVGSGATIFGKPYLESGIFDGFDTDLEPLYDINPFARWYMNGNQNKSHFLELFGAISRFEKKTEVIRTNNNEGYGVYVYDSKDYTLGGLGMGYGYRFLLLDKKMVLEAQIGIKTHFESDAFFGILEPYIARAGFKVGYRF